MYKRQGPASLTCAGELVKRGCDITVFEALHKVGGVLTYGIPEFRLPKDLVQREVSKLGDKGVSFEVNALVGKLYDIDELMEDRGFDAVFVGTGAGLPSYLGIEGEGLNGVSVASELLTRVNLMKAYQFPEYETPVYAGKKCVVAVSYTHLDVYKRQSIYRRSASWRPSRACAWPASIPASSMLPTRPQPSATRTCTSTWCAPASRSTACTRARRRAR